MWLQGWTALVVLLASAADGMAVSWIEWLAYWPGLALALTRIGSASRAVTQLTGRLSRTVVTCGRRLVRSAAPHLVRLVARVLRWAAARLWRAIAPCGRDVAGWLLYRAPGLLARAAGRALLRLARWLPAALVRFVGYAVIGAGWVVAHTAAYCAAYPEYAPLITLAREEDRPRRVYALTVQWRRAALRRSGF